jgi:hypothetical protein
VSGLPEFQREDAMEERPGVVQRAFQIARSGNVANMSALRKQLTAEGYTNNAQSLAGRSISSQLTRMIVAARMNVAPSAPSAET